MLLRGLQYLYLCHLVSDGVMMCNALYEIDSTGGTRVDLILLRGSFDATAGLEWLG